MISTPCSTFLATSSSVSVFAMPIRVRQVPASLCTDSGWVSRNTEWRTSLAVNAPQWSWNGTPWRRVMVQVLPSGDMAHVSASSGMYAPVCRSIPTKYSSAGRLSSIPLRLCSQEKLVSQPRGATATTSRSSFAFAGGAAVCAQAMAAANPTTPSNPHRDPTTLCIVTSCVPLYTCGGTMATSDGRWKGPVALLPCARDDCLTSAAGASTPDDAPACLQGGGRTRGPGHNDAKPLLEALRHVCRRSACGARDTVLLTRLQDAPQPCLHLRVSRMSTLPQRDRQIARARPDRPDPFDLLENIPNVAHAFRLLHDAHQQELTVRVQRPHIRFVIVVLWRQPPVARGEPWPPAALAPGLEIGDAGDLGIARRDDGRLRVFDGIEVWEH